MAIAVFSAGQPVSGNGLTNQDQLNDLELAERAFELALADITDVFDTPVIVMTDGTGSGSLVARHRVLTLGWGLSMGATAAEDTDVSASSVDASAADVTVARRALRLDMTGLAVSIGGAWGFDPVTLGLTMANSFRAGRMDLFATAAAAASTNITSTSVGTADDLLDCIDSFTNSVGDPGQLFGFLRPQTAQGIRDSMGSAAGPSRERPDVQAFLAKGAEMLFGILCWQTPKVVSSGGYYQNAIMAPGAIAYRIAQPSRMYRQVIAAPSDMPILIGIQDDISRDVTEIVANGYDGLAIREQARIRGLLGVV